MGWKKVKKAVKKVVKVAPKVVKVADSPVMHTVGTAVGTAFGAPGAYDNAVGTIKQGAEMAQKANVLVDRAEGLYQNGVAIYQYYRDGQPAEVLEEDFVMSETQGVSTVRGEGASTLGVQGASGVASARAGSASMAGSTQGQSFVDWLLSLLFGR